MNETPVSLRLGDVGRRRRTMVLPSGCRICDPTNELSAGVSLMVKNDRGTGVHAVINE